MQVISRKGEANCSVTRSQPTLGSRIPSGNWDQDSICKRGWNALLSKRKVPGWVCGRLGSCWGNYSTSQLSVGALNGGAPRGTLRHKFQLYGVQQGGKFSNVRKNERGIQSASQFERLLSTLKRWANKDWARLVPAAAVIPAVRVVATFIRSKTFVAGFASSLWNCCT